MRCLRPYVNLRVVPDNNARRNLPILQTYMAPTVLVVDDERAQGELLRRWLDSWGYKVQARPLCARSARGDGG